MIDLDAEIAALDRQLKALVAKAAPATTARVAVATGHAGALLVCAGQNIGRLRSEASFAALCGASPLPVATGRTDRHRLNYGGNRDANRALHMIAVCRLRYCQRTRAYADRRTAEGKTKTEIIRCLKRYIARELYHALLADLTPASASPRRSGPIVSITCGAGPIGRTIALDIYRNVPAWLTTPPAALWTSAPWTGTVDGETCQGTRTGHCADLVRELAAVHGPLRATELIYCWDPDGPADPRGFARADHCDHIHWGMD